MSMAILFRGIWVFPLFTGRGPVQWRLSRAVVEVDRLRVFTVKDVSGQISGPNVVSTLGFRPPIPAKS